MDTPPWFTQKYLTQLIWVHFLAAHNSLLGKLIKWLDPYNTIKYNVA